MLPCDVSCSAYTDLCAFLYIHVGFWLCNMIRIHQLKWSSSIELVSKNDSWASIPWKFDSLSVDVAFKIWGKIVEQFLHGEILFPETLCFFLFSSRETWPMRLKPSRLSTMPQLCLSQQEATPRTSRCEVQFRSTGPRIFPPWCQNHQYDVRPLLNPRYRSYLSH